MKKIAKIFGWLVIVILFAYGITNLEREAFSQAFNMPWHTVLCLIILQGISFSLVTLQYKWLISNCSYKISYFNMFSINLAGKFMESITPSIKAGGESVKILLLKKELKIEYPQIFAISVAQKTCSIIIYLLLVAGAFIYVDFTFELSLNGPIIFFVILLTALVVFKFLLNKYYAIVVSKIFLVISHLKKFDVKLIVAVLVSNLVVWGLYPLKFLLIANFFGFSLDIWQIMMVVYLADGIAMLPTTPGSVGTFEGGMGVMLSAQGVDFGAAFASAVIFRFFTFWALMLFSAGFISVTKLFGYNKNISL
ncbi:lysylphosphatidylglycerol synthase transmembrane domain-containing protein [Proteinivorax tanatarense]|uniref:Phosphatidylglycerol lysyltransferase n=1 Tax=Proteinivorax tanatarense TaxID=1260629 RepID=A0AAU7VQ40_9FIRM